MSSSPLFTTIREKLAHAGFQKYFKNTSWMLVSRVLCMGLAFITTATVARKLGPENFGQLNYAVSFVSLFSILATLGIDTILYRDLLNHPDKKKQYLGSALGIKLIAGTFTLVLVSLSALWFAEDPISQILIIILSSTFVFNAFQIANHEFQAQVKSKYPSIISFIITLIVSVLRIVAVTTGHGVIYLAAILVIESILYGLFYWYFYERTIGGKMSDWRFDRTIAWLLLKDSWVLIFMNAFSLIYARIDQVFIKHMLDATSVGVYSAGVTLAEVWYFIPAIIITSVFPAIMNAKKHSLELYHARLRRLSLLLLVIAITVSIGVTFVAPYAMTIVYGAEFIQGSIILQIYVWACLGIFLGYLVDNYLVAENQKKALILKTFVPMVVNVILNILWIPQYGIVGSAYATLISYSLSPLTVLILRSTRSQIFKIYAPSHSTAEKN